MEDFKKESFFGSELGKMTVIFAFFLLILILVLFGLTSAFKDLKESSESPYIVDKPMAYDIDTDFRVSPLSEDKKDLKIVGSYINKEITIQKGYKGENSYRVYVSELGREQLCTLKHDTLYAMNDVGVINKNDFFIIDTLKNQIKYNQLVLSKKID